MSYVRPSVGRETRRPRGGIATACYEATTNPKTYRPSGEGAERHTDVAHERAMIHYLHGEQKLSLPPRRNWSPGWDDRRQPPSRRNPSPGWEKKKQLPSRRSPYPLVGKMNSYLRSKEHGRRSITGSQRARARRRISKGRLKGVRRHQKTVTMKRRKLWGHRPITASEDP